MRHPFTPLLKLKIDKTPFPLNILKKKKKFVSKAFNLVSLWLNWYFQTYTNLSVRGGFVAKKVGC
jgi:hypothetical protein